jgi:phosphate transport system permease protein
MATLKQDGSAAELVTGFLAKRRDKSTKRSVILVDRIADWSITVGGLLVILAVVGIMVFLIEVVVPLFAGGEIVRQFAVAKPPVTGRVLLDRIDEYNTISVSVDDNGRIGAFHIATGTVIEAPTLDLGGRTVTAFGSTLNGRDIAFGFASGEVVTGRLANDVQVVPRSAIGAGARPLGGTDFTDGTAVYTELPGDQARRLSVSASLAEPQQVAPPGTAIVGVAYRLGGTVERPTTSLVSVDAAGIARLTRGEARRNLLTGAEQVRFISAELPGLEAGVEVADVLLTSAADQVYIADRGGRIFRFDTRDFANPKLAETRELFSGGVQLSTMRFLIGDQSLVVGGTDGSVNVYFRLQRAGVGTADGYTLVRAHTLEPQSAAITHIEPSQRGKLFVTADASGAIAVRHSTSDQTFFTLRPEGGGTRGFDAVALAPRENAVLAIGDGRVHVWEVSIPHPETTLQTIFGRVWYEGYDEPTFTWQSSSG